MDDLKPCPTETFKTSDGITVTVDAADLHHVAHFNWRMSSGDRYIRAWCADRGKMIAMHRLILGFPDGKSIDHINGDPTVLQDAIYRVLEGKRKWPKGLNLFAFLSGVMRSIVSEQSKIGFRRNVDRDIDKAANIVSEDTSAADLVLETEIVTHVMALFDGDDDAEALAEGVMDGWEKQDLLSLFDGDTTRYETVRKRFKRKVNAHPELKSMIHGE